MKPTEFKLTQWHDGSVKPVHVGVYQRYHNPMYTHYGYWDGNMWHSSQLSARDAFYAKNEKSWHPELKWRGIVKDES